MSNFININKSFDIGNNFWELNPQLAIYPPFSKLYNRDKSKDKKNSSCEMWCIFFMSDPDEELNRFYRMDRENRMKVLSENYYKVDWNSEIIEECLDSYIIECMTSIERTLKNEMDSLRQRSKLIRDTKYTLDGYEYNESGKMVKMVGTAKQLDDMRAKTPKLLDNYETLKDKFLNSKANDGTVYGGRKETAAEKGRI